MSGLPAVRRSPGLQLPPKGAQVDDQTIEFAVSVLSASKVPERLEELLRRPTGRKRALGVLALLVALFCLALDDRPLHLSLATDLLYRRCSQAARTTLGISATVHTHKHFLARYRCVRYLFHRICDAADPSLLPKNRRLTDGELARATKKLSEAEIEQRRARLEQLVNDLVEGSLTAMTDEEVAGYDGSVGLDATPVPLYSRGPSKRTGRSASDPDGGWYVRKGDHRGQEDDKGRVHGKVAWALEATIATMAPPPGEPARYPNLVLGIVLGRPGSDPGGTGARVIASIASRGHKAGLLGADRAYSSALPQAFHLPVRALGYEPVFDYRIDELGIQANSSGATLVEGAWYCPAMPTQLVEATRDYRAGRIDEQTYQARIAARAPHRLRRKDGPDDDGYERLSCPAQGAHPRLICPHRPDSLAPRDGRMKVIDPPAWPPRVCTQSAVTIAPDIGARHRQRLAFGSETWARHYATCRNTIEGLNGFAKDPAHESLAQPARRRVRGIAAQSIFCALLMMAANIRKLRTHREIVTETRTAQINERARRRRTSLKDHRPPP